MRVEVKVTGAVLLIGGYINVTEVLRPIQERLSQEEWLFLFYCALLHTSSPNYGCIHLPPVN